MLDRAADGHANFFNGALWHSNAFHDASETFANRLVEIDNAIRARADAGLRETYSALFDAQQLHVRLDALTTDGSDAPAQQQEHQAFPAVPYHWLMPSRTPTSIAV